MARHFQPGVFAGATSPHVDAIPYVDAETFKIGAVLQMTAGEVEILADPDTPDNIVVGIALQPAGSNPGYDMDFASKLVNVTGRAQKVSVARANRQTVFTGRLVNGATDPVTPAQTDVGVEYGIAIDADGIFVVDQADTTDTWVHVIRIDADTKIVYFRFLEAVLLNP